MKARQLTVSGEDGFSVLELIIAVVILGVITSQMFLVLNAQQRGYRSESASLDVQETTRLVVDLISFDTRNAGMLIPRQVALASIDGGTAAPDRFCVSDGSVFQVPAPGVTNAFWDSLDHTFNGSTGNMVNTSTIGLTSGLDLEGSAVSGGSAIDFVVGSGVIVANGSLDPNGVWVSSYPASRITHCAAITRIQGTQVFIDQPVPGGAGWVPAIKVTAVPAILYEITNPDPQTTRLLRNGIAISDLIEDLQVQYWIDNAPPNGTLDGATEWPLDKLDNQDTSRIRRVRIYALGRTQVADDAGGQALNRYHYPGVANRTEGPVYDAFKRQVFVASVLPRNLFDYLENPGQAVP